MTTLIRPDNGQPADFLAYRDGMVALDTTCISPARRWYTLQVVQACNPTVNVLALLSPLQGCAEPPPMVVFPMPQLYPQAVFLGIANGLLERAKQVVDIRIAVAQGQLPSERKAAA